ncbi:MAG TPA: glycosyltransferase [Candidatus Polarisedimenticolia bacterium]|jgi:glycosyltransferase involved in cell wall biosynthesis
MTLSVLVTTYGRVSYLQRCIESLLGQERPPDEIVIVTREGDTHTETFVAGLIASHRGPVRLIHARVAQPGVLPANRVGIARVTGDIVCFIDDDASARLDWLRRIEAHFLADGQVGAVGGRDVQHTGGASVDEPTDEVGRIYWYGRIVGDHHKSVRGIRYVDHLKGVNMSFRRGLLPPFDEMILGSAHYYEMDLCFAVRRLGYRILFDGDLLVDHYIDAPRFLPGNVVPGDPEREYFIHHNRVYVMLKNLGVSRRAAFLAYSFIIEGFVNALRLVVGSGDMSLRNLKAIYRGKVAGLADYLRTPAGGRRG